MATSFFICATKFQLSESEFTEFCLFFNSANSDSDIVKNSQRKGVQASACLSALQTEVSTPEYESFLNKIHVDIFFTPAPYAPVQNPTGLHLHTEDFPYPARKPVGRIPNRLLAAFR